MAKKIKTVPKYYVYYNNKTGEIFSVTNEKSEKYEAGIEMPFDEIKNFLDGVWHLKDYCVRYKQKDGSLGIVLNDDQGYVFKNGSLETLLETNKSTECIVEWNLKDKNWNILLGNNFKNVYSNLLMNPDLNFYITLETNSNFLIRKLSVKLDDLISKKNISIPFENDIESDINKIAVSTTTVLKDYKLRVVND